MSKKKITLNDSSAEFSKLAKLSQKELGKQQAHGMPDDWDFQNIDRIIMIFDKAHPGLINKIYQDVRREMELTAIDKHGVVNKQAELRRGFWLPNDLELWMQKAYPSFWREKRHAEWFCRKFPLFSFEYAAKQVKH